MGEDWDSGIENEAARAHLPPDRLTRLLVADARGAADRGKADPIGRHVPDFLVLLVLVVVLGSFAVKLRHLDLASVRFGPSPPLASEVVAQATPLPAYHVIDPADVAETPAPAMSGAVPRATEVYGRIVVTPIPSGGVVPASALLPSCGTNPTPTGANTAIVTLPIRASAIGPVQVGDCVTLILSPRDANVPASAGASFPGTRVLSLSNSGDPQAVVLAVPVADVAARASLLRSVGLADALLAPVFPTTPVPPPTVVPAATSTAAGSFP